jgi:hypothetical protein
MVVLLSKIKPRGRFQIEHRDKNGKLLGKYDIPNGITNGGKDDLLDVYFSDGSQTAAANWYIGLIDNSGYTGVAAADTMSSHSGWNEFTSYSEANRVAWGPGAPSSQSITNASPATFNINGSGTVKGVFVVNNNTKSGSTGTLWATALFSADVPVSNGDQLKVTYTVSA